jgi:hypothetical protein
MKFWSLPRSGNGAILQTMITKRVVRVTTMKTARKMMRTRGLRHPSAGGSMVIARRAQQMRTKMGKTTTPGQIPLLPKNEVDPARPPVHVFTVAFGIQG